VKIASLLGNGCHGDWQVRVETDDAVLWLAVADVNHHSTQPRRLRSRIACSLSKTTGR